MSQELTKEQTRLLVGPVHFRANTETGAVKSVFVFFGKSIKLSTGDVTDDLFEFSKSKRANEIRSKIREISKQIVVNGSDPLWIRKYFNNWKNGKEYQPIKRSDEKITSVCFDFSRKNVYIRYYHNGRSRHFSTGVEVWEYSNATVKDTLDEIMRRCRHLADQKPDHKEFKDQVLRYVERMPIFV